MESVFKNYFPIFFERRRAKQEALPIVVRSGVNNVYL